MVPKKTMCFKQIDGKTQVQIRQLHIGVNMFANSLHLTSNQPNGVFYKQHKWNDAIFVDCCCYYWRLV